MKIKTQFLLTMIIFAVVLLIISGSLIITNQEIDRLNKQEEMAVNIERGASELSYLSNAYLIYRERRQGARWEAKWSAVLSDLSRLDPENPEERALVANIKDHQQRLKAVFADVRSILERESPGLSDPGAVRASLEVAWSRMAVQDRETALDALRLSQVFRDEKDMLRQTNSRLIFILLSLFTTYFVVNYFIIYRRTLRSISDLQAGTNVVGAGNLEFAIEVKHDDEVGQLSHAFNRMTASLKDVTASKADLEREVAERKKAEEALAAERKQLAVTLRSIGDGVITTDTEGRVVLINQVAEELTGWRQAEAAGRPIDEVFNIINEKTREPAPDPIKTVLETGKVVGLANHTALIARDGTERSIADSCAPIRDKQDHILGVVLVFRDVTERKQAENAVALLHQVTDISLSSLDARSIAEEFIKLMVDKIGAGQIIVALVDANKRTLNSIAAYGLPNGVLEKILPVGLDSDNEAALVLESGEPVVVDDINAQSISTVAREAIGQIGDVGSFALFPLKAREKTVGTVNFAWPLPRKLSPNDIKFFHAITTELAIGLQNARLYEAEVAAEQQAKEELEISDLLLKAADVMAGELELSKILEILADIVVRFTGRSRVVINLIEEAADSLKETVALSGNIIPIDPSLESEQVPAAAMEALLQNRTVLIDYAGPDVSDEERRRFQAQETQVMLYAPLVVGDRVIGGLAVDEPAQREEFTPREVRLVEGIASQAAVAVGRARLFEAEHRVSATLQEALLTMAEEISGVDYGHVYNSATVEAAEVGGDFYDVFELEHGRIGIIIGDVAGKGVEAAALTALVKNTIRAYAHQKFGPGVVMTLTNDALIKRDVAPIFVTVFFGILNVESQVLLYAVAGHPPPIVKRGASVRLLEYGSPAIGIMAGYKYEEQGTVLHEGETMVLYTDGVTEARRGREFFGEERLIELISTLKPSGPGQMADMIFEQVMDFTRGNLRDDVALLALSLAEPIKTTEKGASRT